MRSVELLSTVSEQKLYTSPVKVSVVLFPAFSTRVVAFQLMFPQLEHVSRGVPVPVFAPVMRALSFTVAALPWSTGGKLKATFAGLVEEGVHMVPLVERV